MRKQGESSGNGGRWPAAMLGAGCALATLCCARVAAAVASAELYTSEAYRFGRFEARIYMPAGDGIVGSFFLWKLGSELPAEYWNELDFEKVGADCSLELNSIYGMPESSHESHGLTGAELCAGYHTYSYEWTPEYIAWFVDGTELRRDTGADAQAYAENAAAGMQLRFNIWPGTPAFGGNFSPEILPAYEYVSWIQYSEHTPSAAAGDFTFAWRQSFEAGIPASYQRGNWASPLAQSEHAPGNALALDGVLILALTEDGAPPFAGAPPADPGDLPSETAGDGAGGAGGTGAMAGSASALGGSAPESPSAAGGSAAAREPSNASCAQAAPGPGGASGLFTALALCIAARRARSPEARR